MNARPSNRLRSALRTIVVLATTAVGLLALAPAPASAASFNGTYQGGCARAAGSAYRSQVKIPVTELNVPRFDENGLAVGTFDATTAYMTMNVEWCTNGSAVTYATIATSHADRTSGGAASNLERKSYRSDFSQPTAVGGPYTLTTSATWGRNIQGKISAAPFNFGGEVQFTSANFTSTMTVKVHAGGPTIEGTPTGPVVDCTGTSGGNAEPCSLNP